MMSTTAQIKPRAILIEDDMTQNAAGGMSWYSFVYLLADLGGGWTARKCVAHDHWALAIGRAVNALLEEYPGIDVIDTRDD